VEAAARALAGGARTVVARLGAAGALAASAHGGVVTAPGFAAEHRNPGWKAPARVELASIDSQFSTHPGDNT